MASASTTAAFSTLLSTLLAALFAALLSILLTTTSLPFGVRSFSVVRVVASILTLARTGGNNARRGISRGLGVVIEGHNLDFRPGVPSKGKLLVGIIFIARGNVHQIVLDGQALALGVLGRERHVAGDVGPPEELRVRHLAGAVGAASTREEVNLSALGAAGVEADACFSL